MNGKSVGTKLTPKMIGDISAAYKAGRTTTEIALEYGLSKATVCRGLRKVGINPERKDNLFTQKELSTEQAAAITLDYKNGMSLKDLGEKYESSYPVITKILNDNGVWNSKKISNVTPINTKTIQTDSGDIKKILGLEEQKQLCEKYVNGPDTKQDLAVEYEINIDTVSAILRRNKETVKRYIDPNIREQIFVEYKKGLVTVSELSNLYQINPDTIRYWLRKEDLLGTGEIEASKEDVPAPTLRRLAREMSPKALEILEKMLDNPEVPSRDRIAAAKLLLERGYGRPKEEPESDEKEQGSAADRILKLIRK